MRLLSPVSSPTVSSRLAAVGNGEFYRWRSIARAAAAHDDLVAGLRHTAYAAGWKKFEPLWDFAIRATRAGMMLPVLETILSEFGRRPPGSAAPRRPIGGQVGAVGPGPGVAPLLFHARENGQ
jgi:hypothetical protein